QALRLGVDPLPANIDGNRPPAAGMDVKVEPVLDGLALGHHLEPDARPATLRIDDAVLADAQVGLGQSDVAPVVVPASKAGRGRLTFVSQGGGPEVGKPVRIGTIDD